MCPGCIVSVAVAATLWSSGKTVEVVAGWRRARALRALEAEDAEAAAPPEAHGSGEGPPAGAALTAADAR